MRVEEKLLRDKFGADISTEFGEGYRKLEDEGVLKVTPSGVDVTPSGLLQIDRHLPLFFEPQHMSKRYA